MKTRKIFCKNIYMLRKKRNLFQKDIAYKIGVAVNTYCYYESGTREPGMDRIKSIADFFGVSIDFLLGYKAKNIS